jgi:hypothetical protein
VPLITGRGVGDSVFRAPWRIQEPNGLRRDRERWDNVWRIPRRGVCSVSATTCARDARAGTPQSCSNGRSSASGQCPSTTRIVPVSIRLGSRKQLIEVRGAETGTLLGCVANDAVAFSEDRGNVELMTATLAKILPAHGVPLEIQGRLLCSGPSLLSLGGWRGMPTTRWMRAWWLTVPNIRRSARDAARSVR